MQGASEGIEDQAQHLERHDAQQWLVVSRETENDGRVALSLRKGEVALRHRPPDQGAVGQREVHLAPGREADALPGRFGQEGVHRSTVDEEADVGDCAGGTANRALDIAQAHAPESGDAAKGRVIGKVRGGAKRRQGIGSLTRAGKDPVGYLTLLQGVPRETLRCLTPE
jgi:hypothetical protein